MDIGVLVSLVSLVLALSIASERLVEILKGLFEWLAEKKDSTKDEGRRRAALHGLAIVSGIVTAGLAGAVIPEDLLGTDKWLTVVGLGLLASGGSGFWNSILAYLLQIKELKKVEVERQEVEVENQKLDIQSRGIELVAKKRALGIVTNAVESRSNFA